LDNVTHTLFALTLARTPLGRAGRGTTAALVIASNAPDVDIVTAIPGGFVTYLRWHRGPTHGPIGVVGLGILTAALVWAWYRFLDRRRAGGEPRRSGDPVAAFGMLAVIGMLGVFLHVLMDLPTSYGTRLLSPFDWHWYSVDWMPIIDVYLLIAIVVGLALGRGSAAARGRNAAIVLTLMAANYGVRAVAHHEALALAPRLFGPTLPQPCLDGAAASGVVGVWPDERRILDAAFAVSGRRCLVEMAAIPNFFSPFSWRIVARFSNAYEVHDVNLLDARFRTPASESEAFWRRAVRYPNVWTDAVVQAARTSTAQVFLGFSRFPAARAFVDAAGAATVRLSDVRFAGSGFVDQARRTDPFTVIVRTSPDGRVTEEAFGR
jgi:membrane-bound metal-dependent hydrolase YbcI (DUF457 family)